MTRPRLVIALAALVGLSALGAGIIAGRDDDSAGMVRVIAVGHGPAAVAFDPRTQRAFVANGADNTVSVLDTAREIPIRTVAVGDGPARLAVDVRAGRVAVVNTYGLSVSILDAANGRLLRTISLGATPTDALLDARTGRLFIAKADLSVDVIDVRRGTLLRTVAAGTSPYQGSIPLAVDEASGRLFTVNTDGDTAATVDAVSGAIRRIVTVSHSPYAVVTDSATRRAFVVGADGVDALDTRSGTVVRRVRLPLGLGAQEPTPVIDVRTQRVFVPAFNGNLYVLDAATGQLLRVIPGLMPMAVDTRTNRVFSFDSGSVSLLDARSGRVLHTIPLNGSPFSGSPFYNIPDLAVDPRSGQVLVLLAFPVDSAGDFASAGRFLVLDGSSGAIRQSVPIGANPVALAVAPSSHGGRDGDRAIILDAGGTVPVPDAWAWLPRPLRRFLPMLPPPGRRTRIVPANVRIINLKT